MSFARLLAPASSSPPASPASSRPFEGLPFVESLPDFHRSADLPSALPALLRPAGFAELPSAVPPPSRVRLHRDAFGFSARSQVLPSPTCRWLSAARGCTSHRSAFSAGGFPCLSAQPGPLSSSRTIERSTRGSPPCCRLGPLTLAGARQSSAGAVWPRASATSAISVSHCSSGRNPAIRIRLAESAEVYSHQAATRTGHKPTRTAPAMKHR